MSKRKITITDRKGERVHEWDERPPPEITRIKPEIGGFDPSTHKHYLATGETKGSHQDRAKAFQIRTKHVSLAAAIASVPIAVVGFSVPLLSLPILLWIFGTYASVWIVAYVWDVAASPDGVALIRALAEAWEIRAERKERHKHYREK